MSAVSSQRFHEQLQMVNERLAELMGSSNAPTVVAVTKGHGPEAIRLAQASGLPVGENYAQECLSKVSELGELGNCPVHFIGQLQSNKVRQLAGLVDVWQTVDRQSLVKELAKRVPGANVFVQVNATSDPGRGGCDWSEVGKLVDQARHAGLTVRGLMTVGIQGDFAQSRHVFKRLAKLRNEVAVEELSMGMSDDWEIAVEEGSTLIRLGRALFGER